MSARTPSDPANCLSDEDIAAFAQGRLSPGESLRVEQHVDDCETCAPLLHQAMRTLNTTLVSNVEESRTDFATTFAPGTLVAERYEIKRFIARGGMGEVYQAYDRELQDRVALKTVSSTASDSPRAIRSLKAEVQLARRVTHANVCRIYDLGTHTLKNGGVVHFLTMEFVEGETLGQILRTQGALPLDECNRFARALLQGLAAAHSAGILHRDFKSDNVIVRRASDGRLTPVILDFGLARHIDERARARSSGHAMVGTLTYMAPEQVEGSPLSSATDIYAFGVVWFEMLTGRIPFAGPPQLSALERLTKAPSAPGRLNRQIPHFVDAAVLRCLARQPSQRFQSAQEVLSALDAVSGPKIVPSKRFSPLLIGASTLLAGSLVYAVVRNDTKLAVNVAPAITATASPSASESASLPLRMPPDSASEDALFSARLPTRTVPKRPLARPKAPAPSSAASAPKPNAALLASTAASSESTQREPVKRPWPFGRIPKAVASTSTNASAQNRTP